MKAKFIYEAIKHLGPKSKEEIAALVEKEPILDQIRLLQHNEYAWLRAKLFSEKNINQTKKKIREAIWKEIRYDGWFDELSILSFLKNWGWIHDISWYYTEIYNKLIKLAKTTPDIKEMITEAAGSWSWNNWENSQNLKFPPIIEILLKRAKEKKLDVIDEDVYEYMYRNKIDPTEYIQKLPDTNFQFKRIDNNMFDISFNEWSDFSPYFEESRDIDKEFVENMLSAEGDGFEKYFMGNRRDDEFPDFSYTFLKAIEKNCFKDLKEIFAKKHPEIKEKFSNIYDFWAQLIELESNGDLNKKFRYAIVQATNETAEMADSEEAYKELKEAIINYFDLIDVKYKIKKWRGRIHKNDLRKFMSIQYIPDNVKKIEYSAPSYGYNGDVEDHPDVFVDCLDNTLSDL